jgi:peptidyl-prolyl cis-trans isomerase SurA
MRWFVLSLIIVGIMAFTCYGVELVDKVVAVVDDDPILASEIEAYAQFVMQQDKRQLNENEAEKLRSQILSELIDRRVLLAQARKDSIVVEDREVDQELQSRLDKEIENLGSVEKLEQAYGRPLRQLKRDLRDRIREGMMIDRVKYQKQQQITVTRGDVEAFWNAYQDSLPELPEAVKIRHILRNLRPSTNARQAALDRTWELYNEIKGGKDFEEVARESSDDPGTASKGGDLGETNRGDLVPAFEEVAFQMNDGDISEPVETSFGFHIIRLDWRHGEKIHAHHILVRLKTAGVDEEEAKAFLDSLRTRILAGESFVDLAKQYSDDKDSAPAGGLLGWYELANLPSDFRNAIQGLQTNDISEPFISEFGAHIIQVVDRQDKRKMSLAQDWDRIELMAKNQKQEKVFQDWIDKLRQQVYIDTVLVAGAQQ